MGVWRGGLFSNRKLKHKQSVLQSAEHRSGVVFLGFLPSGKIPHWLKRFVLFFCDCSLLLTPNVVARTDFWFALSADCCWYAARFTFWSILLIAFFFGEGCTAGDTTASRLPNGTRLPSAWIKVMTWSEHIGALSLVSSLLLLSSHATNVLRPINFFRST